MAENIHSVLLMRYNKLWHPQRIDQAEEVLHSEFARHGSSGSFRGIPSFKQYVKHFLSAFPDAQFLFRDWLWEGDKVAISYQFVGTHNGNFLGIPPTGKQKRIEGASIYRFADGKIMELWDFLDLIARISYRSRNTYFMPCIFEKLYALTRWLFLINAPLVFCPKSQGRNRA